MLSRDQERDEQAMVASILRHRIGDRLFGIMNYTGKVEYRITRTGRTFAFDLDDGVITAAYDLGITRDEDSPHRQDVIYSVVFFEKDDADDDEIPFCDFSNILDKETEASECLQL